MNLSRIDKILSLKGRDYEIEAQRVLTGKDLQDIVETLSEGVPIQYFVKEVSISNADFKNSNTFPIPLIQPVANKAIVVDSLFLSGNYIDNDGMPDVLFGVRQCFADAVGAGLSELVVAQYVVNLAPIIGAPNPVNLKYAILLPFYGMTFMENTALNSDFVLKGSTDGGAGFDIQNFTVKLVYHFE